MPAPPRRSGRTLVTVAGYDALAAGSVERSAAAGRRRRGMPGHPVPVVVLARPAVDLGDQRNGVGRGLLRDALAPSRPPRASARAR
jgi:predicted N-acetyltransferase YhbS